MEPDLLTEYVADLDRMIESGRRTFLLPVLGVPITSSFDWWEFGDLDEVPCVVSQSPNDEWAIFVTCVLDDSVTVDLSELLLEISSESDEIRRIEPAGPFRELFAAGSSWCGWATGAAGRVLVSGIEAPVPTAVEPADLDALRAASILEVQRELAEG